MRWVDLYDGPGAGFFGRRGYLDIGSAKADDAAAQAHRCGTPKENLTRPTYLVLLEKRVGKVMAEAEQARCCTQRFSIFVCRDRSSPET